jgi:hypothetical protein
MATRVAFLKESLRILPILLAVICLLAPMEAQHGGGGGHSGGGHSGGGRSGGGHASSGHASSTHSAGGHSGGHFGWLHFGFGKHSVRHPGLGAVPASDFSTHGPLRWSSTTARMPSTVRISSTLLSSPLIPRRPEGQASFFASGRRHRDFFSRRYRRFSPSGCFFNGFTQVCFFEPFLPLFSFSGYFDPFDFGFGGDSQDPGDDPNLQGTPQWEMSAAPPANPSDDNTAEGNFSAQPGSTLHAATEGEGLGKGVFVVVLNNGTSHAVTDYWVADGYLEYINPDGTRSHIPLEALDLQKTVSENAPRGRPFVLRSTPAENR